MKKIKHPLLIKALIKLRIKGNFLNLVANIRLNSERLGTEQQYLLSAFLLNIVLEVLDSAIMPSSTLEKAYRASGKKDIKLFPFSDDMIVNVENLLKSIRKLLEPISEFGKVAGYKANI